MASTDAERIASDLRACLTGVGNAQGHVAAGAEHARKVTAKMTAAGFDGIAKGIIQITELLNGVHARMTGVAGNVNASLSQVLAVTHDSSPQDIVSRLSAAINEMDTARSSATRTVLDLATAQSRVEQVLQGGMPEKLLRMIGEASREFRTGKGFLDTAMTTTAEVSASARQAGASPLGSGTGEPEQPAHAGAPARGVPIYPLNAGHSISWSDLHHVVHGDPDDESSGGHRHGLGRPGKTEFPAGWNEEDIRDAVLAVARHPGRVAERPGGMWRADGTHRGVVIRTWVRSDGTVASGYPLSGPGVRQNPPRRDR